MAGPLGTLALGPANGGTNWPGGSFNPENHTVYVYACNACLSAHGAGPPPPGMTRSGLCRRPWRASGW